MLGLTLIVGVAVLGTTISAYPRAIRQNISNQGFGYKAFTTNNKYEMITNGKDGEVWVVFNSSTENTLYRFEGAVDDLISAEKYLRGEGMVYSKINSIIKLIITGDLSNAIKQLAAFFDSSTVGQEKADELNFIVEDLVYYYDKLLDYEAPESKNECIWNGSTWTCKFNQGEHNEN